MSSGIHSYGRLNKKPGKLLVRVANPRASEKGNLSEKLCTSFISPNVQRAKYCGIFYFDNVLCRNWTTENKTQRKGKMKLSENKI